MPERRWAVTVSLRLEVRGPDPEAAVRAEIQQHLPRAEVLGVRAEPLLAAGDVVVYDRDGRREFALVEEGPQGLRLRLGDGTVRPLELKRIAPPETISPPESMPQNPTLQIPRRKG